MYLYFWNNFNMKDIVITIFIVLLCLKTRFILMYKEINQTQITLSCLSNMILNKDYEIIKFFVDLYHPLVQTYLYRLAKELDRNLVDKIEREEWPINKTF